MQLRSGVPLISDLDQLKGDPYYSQITTYSRDFLARHANALAGYGRLWGQDPFKLWSRRWEYPFAAQKTIEYGKAHLTPIKVIDAGSGEDAVLVNGGRRIDHVRACAAVGRRRPRSSVDARASELGVRAVADLDADRSKRIGGPYRSDVCPLL